MALCTLPRSASCASRSLDLAPSAAGVRAPARAAASMRAIACSILPSAWLTLSCPMPRRDIMFVRDWKSSGRAARAAVLTQARPPLKERGKRGRRLRSPPAAPPGYSDQGASMAAEPRLLAKPFAPLRWTRCRLPIRGIRACRWAWRMWRPCCSRIFEARPARSRLADRDRFVLSAGHGSMLVYALLHLSAMRSRRSRTSPISGR
jgi:hypothetical protein